MNSLKKIICITLAVVLAVALGWWFASSRSFFNPAAPLSTPNAPEPLKPGSSPGPPQIVQPYARTPYLGLNDPRWVERRRLRVEDPSYQWRTPITFYGKVIDELNQPINGASIEVTWSGTVEKYGGDGVSGRMLASDANGQFTLGGVEGKGLSVRVTKEGYHVPRSSNMRSFEYAGFWEPSFIEPDSTKPVIFHLVKRTEAEPTCRIFNRFFINPPGLETHFDLLSPKPQTNAPADLHVRFVRPPGAAHGKKMDWSVTIEGEGGAEIVATKDEFMQRAPNEGYQPRLTFQYKDDTGEDSVRFYVRSKARKFYAAVDMEMDVYRKMNGTEPASIIITATINPNDSPNVEYDPQKNIRKMATK